MKNSTLLRLKCLCRVSCSNHATHAKRRVGSRTNVHRNRLFTIIHKIRPPLNAAGLRYQYSRTFLYVLRWSPALHDQKPCEIFTVPVRSTREGNVFTGVYHSVHWERVSLSHDALGSPHLQRISQEGLVRMEGPPPTHTAGAPFPHPLPTLLVHPSPNTEAIQVLMERTTRRYTWGGGGGAVLSINVHNIFHSLEFYSELKWALTAGEKPKEMFYWIFSYLNNCCVRYMYPRSITQTSHHTVTHINIELIRMLCLQIFRPIFLYPLSISAEMCNKLIQFFL